MKRITCSLVFALAACGGGTTAHLALNGRAGSTASTAAIGAGSQAQALTANGITITRLRVVVSEVKLEGPAAADAGTGEEIEFKSAPILIDLTDGALDNGTAQQVTVADVKAGTYSEIRFKIHKVASNDPGVSGDAGLTEMASKNASIIVDGFVGTDTPANRFSFVSAVNPPEQRLEGTLNLTDGSHAMTMNLDATTWFGTGSPALDPRDSNNKSRIENNIQNSFKIFQDDDHDGHEDRH